VLQYESGQFRPEYLWRVPSPARRRTLELREKVFGTGRRLPQGAHGAHGRFNRLQWTLTVDEGHVVGHPSLKATWLLRFFTGWGASAAILKKRSEPRIGAGTPRITDGL